MNIFLGWLVMALGLYVLQSYFLPLIFFHGIGPDLLLLLTISYAFLKGNKLGSFMGFLLGLFEDLATGSFLGVNIFINMLVGFGCGTFSNRVLRDSFILPIVASCVGTMVSYCIHELIIVLLGYGFYPVAHIQMKLLPMLCYNVIFAWPVHVMVHRMDEFVSKKK